MPEYRLQKTREAYQSTSPKTTCSHQWTWDITTDAYHCYKCAGVVGRTELNIRKVWVSSRENDHPDSYFESDELGV